MNVKTIKIQTNYLEMCLKLYQSQVYQFLPWQSLDRETTEALTLKEQKIVEEINAYFDYKIFKLDSPLYFEKNLTNFQKDVIQCVQKIQYGHTKSYQEVATLVNHPSAQRAVGSVMAKNNHMFFIPCHRVIKTNGKIGKFGNTGSIVKYQILNDEKNYLKNHA